MVREAESAPTSCSPRLSAGAGNRAAVRAAALRPDENICVDDVAREEFGILDGITTQEYANSHRPAAFRTISAVIPSCTGRRELGRRILRLRSLCTVSPAYAAPGHDRGASVVVLACAISSRFGEGEIWRRKPAT